MHFGASAYDFFVSIGSDFCHTQRQKEVLIFLSGCGRWQLKTVEDVIELFVRITRYAICVSKSATRVFIETILNPHEKEVIARINEMQYDWRNEQTIGSSERC